MHKTFVTCLIQVLLSVLYSLGTLVVTFPWNFVKYDDSIIMKQICYFYANFLAPNVVIASKLLQITKWGLSEGVQWHLRTIFKNIENKS